MGKKQIMNVYILECSVDYEGSHIYGVVTDINEAWGWCEKRANEHQKRNSVRQIMKLPNGYRILDVCFIFKEFTLGKITEFILGEVKI